MHNEMQWHRQALRQAVTRWQLLTAQVFVLAAVPAGSSEEKCRSMFSNRKGVTAKMNIHLALFTCRKEVTTKTNQVLSCLSKKKQEQEQNSLQPSNKLQSQQPTRHCCYKILLRGWLAGRFLSAPNAMQMLPLPSRRG